MALKLQDVQNVTVTIASGVTSGVLTVTHGLQGPESPTPTILTPDMIKAEITGISGGDATFLFAVVSKITRSTPEDGTFVIQCACYPKIAVADGKVALRVTSLRFHTMQGIDVTP